MRPKLKQNNSGEIEFDPVTGRVLAPKPLENFTLPRANGGEPPHVDTAEATPQPKISHAAAVANVKAWQNKIAEDRIKVRSAQERVKAARVELHNAVVAFQAGDGLTTEQRRIAQARAFAATATAERAERAKLYGTGTSATARAFVQKQMRNGPNRGAFSNAQRARFGMKLPEGVGPARAVRGVVPIKTGG